MPNKRRQRNAFYFFMKEMQENLASQGFTYNMKDIADMAHPKWQLMSLAEKRPYENLALNHKIEYRESGRLTCDGRLVKEVLEEEAKKEDLQRQMRQRVVDFVDGQRLSQEEFIETNCEKKLYFVSFNVLCRVKEDNTYIPLEIALVEYTITHGVSKEYHNFINPGEIPRGYTGAAMRHSDDTHGISVFGHEGSESDYCKIWQDIMDFITPRSGSDLPPLFCAKPDIRQVVGSLEWIAEQAGTQRDLEDIKVLDANYLHMELRAGAGSPAVSYAAAAEELQNTSFDYTPGLKCSFHENLDNIHCALRKVKSLCCIISDVMCRLFNVTATERHLPERVSAVRPYEVFTPTSPNASDAVGRGTPRSSNYGSRPGSAIHERVYSDLPSRSHSGTPRSETGGSIISTLEDSDGSNFSGELDNESEESDSPTENINPPRMLPAGTGSVVQLRQPMSQSIALSLARARAAPAVVPGKGIGRGQRRE